MLFKNILFGLGGTAVVGGVGYGIYVALQSKNKDVKAKEEIGSTNKDSDEEGGENEEDEPEKEESESRSESGRKNDSSGGQGSER